MSASRYSLSPRQPGSTPMAFWALILGIVSFTCFGPLASIPAIVLGHLALSKIKRIGMSGQGLARAGLLLGYANLALCLLITYHFWSAHHAG
jgi:hypothetical protein